MKQYNRRPEQRFVCLAECSNSNWRINSSDSPMILSDYGVMGFRKRDIQVVFVCFWKQLCVVIGRLTKNKHDNWTHKNERLLLLKMRIKHARLPFWLHLTTGTAAMVLTCIHCRHWLLKSQQQHWLARSTRAIFSTSA